MVISAVECYKWGGSQKSTRLAKVKKALYFQDLQREISSKGFIAV